MKHEISWDWNLAQGLHTFFLINYDLLGLVGLVVVFHHFLDRHCHFQEM